MKELLLDAFFARKELHIVDEQHIGLPILCSKTPQLVVLNSVDVFVCKSLRRQIGHPCAFSPGKNMMPDGVQKVSFSQSDSAVQEQRVVSLARGLGYSE